MSFLGQFNKPRMLMFDVEEYLGAGFVGVPSGSIAATPIKDLNWDDAYIAWYFPLDAFIRATGQVKLAIRALYNINAKEFNSDNIPDEAKITTGITPQGVTDFISLFNEISDKFIDHYVKGRIFWNCFVSVEGNDYIQKLTGTHTIVLPDWGSYNFKITNMFSQPTAHNPSQIIDFDNAQELNLQIYEDYINSLKDLMFTIKKFFKVATGSDFQHVELSFDYTVPFIPPQSDPNNS